MLKELLVSLLIGSLCAGAAFFALGIIPGITGRKKAVKSQVRRDRGKDEPEEDEEKRTAGSEKTQRISPQSEWRGGSR